MQLWKDTSKHARFLSKPDVIWFLVLQSNNTWAIAWKVIGYSCSSQFFSCFFLFVEQSLDSSSVLSSSEILLTKIFIIMHVWVLWAKYPWDSNTKDLIMLLLRPNTATSRTYFSAKAESSIQHTTMYCSRFHILTYMCTQKPWQHNSLVLWSSTLGTLVKFSDFKYLAV